MEENQIKLLGWQAERKIENGKEGCHQCERPISVLGLVFGRALVFRAHTEDRDVVASGHMGL